MLIDRDKAIDALLRLGDLYLGQDEVKRGIAQSQRVIYELPSAEPQIIHCKDCKWYESEDKESSYGYCHAMKHCHYSKHWEINIYRTYNEDFFCADAERREEE